MLAVHQALVVPNLLQMLAGKSADEEYPTALAAANRGFDLLEHGLT
jgi:hypothetical protein